MNSDLSLLFFPLLTCVCCHCVLKVTISYECKYADELSIALTVCLSLGEALGAIGDPVILDLLKEYSQDPVIEVGTKHGTHNYKDSEIR